MTTEPLSAADAAHRAWLTDLYAKAAATAQATVLGKQVFGWNDRSAGGRVHSADGDRWLRVVVEQPQWAGGEFWTGNVDANVISGVAKPRVLGHWDWIEGSWAVRAELTTLLDGTPCSDTPELRAPVELPDPWWHELASSLAALATTPTKRIHLRQADLTRRLEVFFGDRPGDPTIDRWTAAHADLHWANLLQPDCVLLDWEGWGLAPAGYDAACLYVHSLLAPATAARVATEFADQLHTRDGLLAQLYATTRLLQRIDEGDYPDMAIPLHHNAQRVLDQLTTTPLLLRQQVPQKPLRRVEEPTSQSDRVRLVVAHLLDVPITVDLQDSRTGHGEQDRRVRGHHELAALPDQVGDPRYQRQTATHRQRRLRLVQQVQPVRPEPVHHEIQKGLAVRALMQLPATVGRQQRVRALLIQPLDLGGHVVERLGPQKKPRPRLTDTPPQDQVITQGRLVGARGEPERLRPTLGIEACRHGERFHQGGLAGAVVTDQEVTRGSRSSPPMRSNCRTIGSVNG